MKCPKCQQEIDDNSKFCNHCGVAVEQETSPESQEKPYDNEYNTIKIALIILCVAIIVLITIAKISDNNSGNENSTVETTETEDDHAYDDYSYDDYSYDDVEEDSFEDSNSSIEVTSFLKCPDFTAEQNSTEMVDQIALTAKENIDDFTSSDAKKIIKKIRKAGHKFYNGPEEMEKYMWYGYLLDYKYDDSDPRSELGTDLTQAIKYVYRDIETVLDSSTKSNLQQIDKDLAKIK